MSQMIRLTSHDTAPIKINPRWPDRHVLIDSQALERLYEAQSRLPSAIKLILTRAYQPEGTLQKLFRATGRRLFSLLYPARRPEINDIFGHNGHANDGTHVDIAISHNGERLNLLPFGVFTPSFIIRRKEYQHRYAILETRKALVAVGFRIHRNPTEALQIHCDFG